MSIDAKEVAEKYEQSGEEGLSSEEKRFLQDRGVTLDQPVPVVFNSPHGGTVSNDPMAILNNLQEQQQTDIEAEVSRRVEAELARRAAVALADVQHETIVAGTPHTGTANPNLHPTSTPINPAPEDLEDDEDEGEEEEDYDEGWNNDERRAELAKRGLDTSGNKEELIARLKESDQEEE